MIFCATTEPQKGPCMIDPSQPNGTSWNEFGWNRQANLLFLDQPYEEIQQPYYCTDTPIELTLDSLTETMSLFQPLLLRQLEMFTHF